MNTHAADHRGGLAARTLTARLFVLPACFVAVLVHVTFGHDDFSTAARFHAGLLCSLALLCTAFAPRGTIPTVAIGIGYFYAALGLPVFNRGMTNTLSGPLRISPPALEDATLAALLYAITAIAAALATDWLTRLSLPREAPSASLDEGPSATTAARLWALLSIATNTATVLGGQRLGSLAQVAASFGSPIISLTLLYWDAVRTNSPSAHRVCWAATGYLGVTGLLTGMLENALLPGVVLAALLWAGRGKLPIKLFVFGVLFLLILNPAKHEFRAQAWWGNNGPTGVLERAGIWADALERTYGGDDTDAELNRSIDSTSSRISVLGQVGQIFEWVPSRVGHAGPEKWLMVPVLLTPRLFWSDKPIQEQFFNKDYTYAFRLQSRHQRGTSITLPSVGDGYWRMGWPGVFIEGAVLGFLLGLSQGISRRHTRTALLMAAALIQLRTDYHAFGSFTGLLQRMFVALLVSIGVKWLASALSEPIRPQVQGPISHGYAGGRQPPDRRA